MISPARIAFENIRRRQKPGKHTLPRVRLLKIVALVAIMVGAGILIYPFTPVIRYAVTGGKPVYPYPTKLLAAPSGTLPTAAARAQLPTENRLVIPKIGVNMKIVEGTNEKALYAGAWHIPKTSTPDKGGNTVLSGHRFQYLSGPNTLMLLNEMKPGDPIIVYWQGEEYDYRVEEIKIISKTQVEILKNTEDDRLTIFTCNPPYRYNAEERLVVFAKKIVPESERA